MFKLRQTWTDILPNKILYNLDISVAKVDPAWPITAKNPSKKILINPKFIAGSSEKVCKFIYVVKNIYIFIYNFLLKINIIQFFFFRNSETSHF